MATIYHASDLCVAKSTVCVQTFRACIYRSIFLMNFVCVTFAPHTHTHKLRTRVRSLCFCCCNKRMCKKIQVTNHIANDRIIQSRALSHTAHTCFFLLLLLYVIRFVFPPVANINEKGAGNENRWQYTYLCCVALCGIQYHIILSMIHILYIYFVTLFLCILIFTILIGHLICFLWYFFFFIDFFTFQIIVSLCCCYRMDYWQKKQLEN